MVVTLARLDETGVDGIQVLSDICSMIAINGYETEVLAASIRSVEKFEQAVVAGADCVTLPVAVFEEALHHPLILPGMQKFAADWKRLNNTRFP